MSRRSCKNISIIHSDIQIHASYVRSARFVSPQASATSKRGPRKYGMASPSQGGLDWISEAIVDDAKRCFVLDRSSLSRATPAIVTGEDNHARNLLCAGSSGSLAAKPRSIRARVRSFLPADTWQRALHGRAGPDTRPANCRDPKEHSGARPVTHKGRPRSQLCWMVVFGGFFGFFSFASSGPVAFWHQRNGSTSEARSMAHLLVCGPANVSSVDSKVTEKMDA